MAPEGQRETLRGFCADHRLWVYRQWTITVRTGTGGRALYHRHQASEDPYRNIGQQDMTAHVNFSSLKKWGDELRLKTGVSVPRGPNLFLWDW